MLGNSPGGSTEMREWLDEIFGGAACRWFCKGAAERVEDLMTHSLLLTLLIRYGQMLKVRRWISIWEAQGPRSNVVRFPILHCAIVSWWQDSKGRTAMFYLENSNDCRKVEAELLGCCGRACGWNGHSCMSWPFLSRHEKISWLEECCSEFNVLQGSTRERMCDSVLSPKQIQAVSKLNEKAKEGTDVGVYIGQDSLLLWTEKGLSQFKDQLKPKEGDLVDSNFLEKNPNIRQEGIEKGWFREETVADEDHRPASFAEIGRSTCDWQLTKLKQEDTMQRCPDAIWMQVRNTCLRQDAGWQASAKPDPFDECQMRMIDTSVNPPARVATPDECLKVKFTNVGEIKRRFFVYDTSDPPGGKLVLENPILCFSEPQNLRCPAYEDFEGKNAREIEPKPHEGFADYIYWIDLDREDSKA